MQDDCNKLEGNSGFMLFCEKTVYRNYLNLCELSSTGKASFRKLESYAHF